MKARWVYNDKLQIKLTFLSGPMIFSRFMALGRETQSCTVLLKMLNEATFKQIIF
jgi:hypothetical protein